MKAGAGFTKPTRLLWSLAIGLGLTFGLLLACAPRQIADVHVPSVEQPVERKLDWGQISNAGWDLEGPAPSDAVTSAGSDPPSVSAPAPANAADARPPDPGPSGEQGTVPGSSSPSRPAGPPFMSAPPAARTFADRVPGRELASSDPAGAPGGAFATAETASRPSMAPGAASLDGHLAGFDAPGSLLLAPPLPDSTQLASV